MGDVAAQYKQKISNDAVLKQPTYAHDKELTWATFLLEREDFIQALSLETILDGAGELESWKKRAIMLSLKKAAKELASSITAEDRNNLTYAALEQRLSQIFCPPAESQLLKQEFKQLKQKKAEDISIYLSAKQSLYNRAYGEEERSNEFLVEQTIKGIYNQEVKKQLVTATFNINNPITEFDSLRKAALGACAMERAKMELGISESTSMDGLTSRTQHSFSNARQGHDDVEDMDISKLGDKRCFKCNRYGHLQKDCRSKGVQSNQKNQSQGQGRGSGGNTNGKKSKCFKCGRPGHKAKQCFAATHKNGTKIANPGKPPTKVNQVLTATTDQDGQGGEVDASSSGED